MCDTKPVNIRYSVILVEVLDTVSPFSDCVSGVSPLGASLHRGSDLIIICVGGGGGAAISFCLTEIESSEPMVKSLSWRRINNHVECF